MNIETMITTAIILSFGNNYAHCQPAPSNQIQFQSQPSQWSPRPAQADSQWTYGEWSPWQPVPTESQSGRLHGNPPSGQQTYEVVVPAEFHSVPGYQLQSQYKTVYREETHQKRIFNPGTGKYEIVTYKQAVPFQVPVPNTGNLSPSSRNSLTQVPRNSYFLVTVVNQLGQEVTFNIGGNSQKIPAGSSWQFNASHGQQYSYSGAPRQVGPGAAVGGATFNGSISQNQRTIYLGQSTPKQNNPYQLVGGLFQVKFINTNSSSVDLSVFDKNGIQVASAKIQGGGQYYTSAKDGYTYAQGGPIVFRNGGAVSTVTKGEISSSNTTIQLGS